MSERTEGEARFWELAAPLLDQAGVTRSTMMGFPCLRLQGQFFASVDRRTGDLVVKLDEDRVSRLVAEAHAGGGLTPTRRVARPKRSRR